MTDVSTSRLAVVPAVLVAGVSAAAGQQAVPNCLEQRATIVGTAGNDTLSGTSGQDVIDGLQGNDTIDGGLGDDLICARDGDDMVLGNNGSDGLVGGLGNDRLDGGIGEVNVAVYFETPGAVAVDLAAGSVTGASGNDSLVNINAVVGSRRADTLKGGTGEDLLVGLGGDDVLAGRGASDILRIRRGRPSDGRRRPRHRGLQLRAAAHSGQSHHEPRLRRGP